MQVTFAPGGFRNGQIGELMETPGLSAGAWQMRPLSRRFLPQVRTAQKTRGGMALRRKTCSIGRADYRAQFWISNPLMRRNSRSLLVTRVRPAARACAAIHKSLLPIMPPSLANPARIDP